MIYKAFNTCVKGIFFLQKQRFSSQIKIYEGMVISQKLKYTLKDNLEYRQLGVRNYKQNTLEKSQRDKYVDRMLLSSIFSRIIGSNLSMSIYLSQKVDIIKDLPLNEEVEGRVQISKNLGKDRYLLITEALGKNQNGETVKYLTGQARIIQIKIQIIKSPNKAQVQSQKPKQPLMNIQSSELQLRSRYFILFLAFAISTGAFVMGYALVGTALLQENIKTQNHLTKEQIHFYLSVIVTLLPLGAIVGSLVCGKLVNSIGQKNSMILVDIMMICAVFVQSYSLELHAMYLTRFIFGFFCGVSSSIIPPYLTSISPLSMTGFIGSFNQLFITIGISVAYALNFFIESDIMAKQYQIAIFALIPFPFCALRIITLSFIFPYDTVERHFQRKEIDSVQNIMNQIYNNANFDEYCNIKNLTDQEKAPSSKQKISDSGSETKINILGRRRIILLGIVIAISNQVCGINAIFFYAKQLFTNLTNNDQDAVKKDLFGLGVFQVLMTFVSSIFLDRFGRRSLMLMGHTIVVISLFSAFLATDVLNLSSGIVVFLVFMHIFGFSISLGPICCLYASQIMQDIGYVLIMMWSQTLIVAMVSDLMINSMGIGRTFLIFGIASLGCLIYFCKQMIESKGLNRAQMQIKFSHSNNCTVRIDVKQEMEEMQEIAQVEN